MDHLGYVEVQIEVHVSRQFGQYTYSKRQLQLIVKRGDDAHAAAARQSAILSTSTIMWFLLIGKGNRPARTNWCFPFLSRSGAVLELWLSVSISMMRGGFR